MAVCSTPSPSIAEEVAGLAEEEEADEAVLGWVAVPDAAAALAAAAAATLLKFRLILAMQWSAGSKRFR